MTTEELLEARTRQILQHQDNIKTAGSNLKKSRTVAKDYFEKTKPMRKEKLQQGDMVLLHDTKLDTQWSQKLNMRWTGPLLISQVHPNGTYKLTELDSTPLAVTHHGSRLKLFHPREYNEGIIFST